MITATMATTEARAEEAFAVALALAPQVDRIQIAVNNCENADHLPSLPNLEYLVGYGDLADNAKFMSPPTLGWHFTVDDDLNYPPDYVERTLELGGHLPGVVSWHGAIVRPPVESYYRDKLSFHCLGTVEKATRVHIPGTGCMAYRVSAVRLQAIDFPIPYMADIWAGLRCQLEDIPVTVLPHRAGWITLREQDQADTIWGQFHQNDKIQTWLINQPPWRPL